MYSNFYSGSFLDSDRYRKSKFSFDFMVELFMNFKDGRIFYLKISYPEDYMDNYGKKKAFDNRNYLDHTCV